MAVHEEMTNEENANPRLVELEALGKDRLVAQQNWSHIDNVWIWSFQNGDLVLGIQLHDHQ